MIKVTSISLNPQTKKAVVSLFADTKSEITDGMVIDGFPEGYEIDFGSNVLTASGEVAFVKSDGTFNWLS